MESCVHTIDPDQQVGGGKQTRSQFVQFLHFRNSFTMTNHNGVNTCKQRERKQARVWSEGAGGGHGEDIWGSAGHLASGPTEDNRRPAFTSTAFNFVNQQTALCTNPLHLCMMDSEIRAEYGWVHTGN